MPFAHEKGLTHAVCVRPRFNAFGFRPAPVTQAALRLCYEQFAAN